MDDTDIYKLFSKALLYNVASKIIPIIYKRHFHRKCVGNIVHVILLSI